jgi:hypothetical protein
VPEEVHVVDILPQVQRSPLTHHLTPASLMQIASEISTHLPKARLVSVLGHSFGFSQQLSAPTSTLADHAVDLILSWLKI